jgi:hypothetical protein
MNIECNERCNDAAVREDGGQIQLAAQWMSATHRNPSLFAAVTSSDFQQGGALRRCV